MSNKNNVLTVGSVMKKIRLEHKTKATVLCSALNISNCEYSQIEHDKRLPNLVFIDDFSQYFELSDIERIRLKVMSKIDIFEKVFEKDRFTIYSELFGKLAKEDNGLNE